MKFVLLPESLVPGKVMYVFGFYTLISIYLHLALTTNQVTDRWESQNT